MMRPSSKPKLSTHWSNLPILGRVFYAGATAVALGIGALQMFGVNAGFVTNYGADLFGTAWLYCLCRLGKSWLQRGHKPSAEATAIIIFVLCTASEVGQRLRVVPGIFDPFDILAYGLSVLACYLFDRRFDPFGLQGTIASSVAEA